MVPASFTPVPEQFKKPVTQELRNRQAKMTQGYTLERVNNLEIQLHKSWYKRISTWQEMPEAESNAALIEAIKVAKTAKTVMQSEIQEWAGNLTEAEMTDALPIIWNGYVQRIQEPTEVVEETEATVEEVVEEDALAPEDMEPVQVIDRPEIPDDAPKSEVVAPKEESLGEILGKIAEDNTKD